MATRKKKSNLKAVYIAAGIFMSACLIAGFIGFMFWLDRDGESSPANGDVAAELDVRKLDDTAIDEIKQDKHIDERFVFTGKMVHSGSFGRDVIMEVPYRDDIILVKVDFPDTDDVLYLLESKSRTFIVNAELAVYTWHNPEYMMSFYSAEIVKD